MKRLALLALLAGGLLAAPALAQTYQPDPDTLVQSWYARFLGRQATGQGSSYWVQQLVNGDSPDHVLAGIIGSTEYYQRHGSSAQGVVQGWYMDTSGQQPPPQDMSYWSDHIAAVGLSQAAYDFLQQHPNSWQTVLPPSQPTYESVAPPQSYPTYQPPRLHYRPGFRPYGRPYGHEFERR